MKRFEAKVRYTFDGHFIVRAASGKDAARMVTAWCGLTLGDVECPDWEFLTHPDMRVVTIKKV